MNPEQVNKEQDQRRRDEEKSILIPANLLWMKNEFDKLHHEHALILKKLNDQTISPELEEQVLKVSKMALKIDQKVPDKPPPAFTPNP